MIKHKNDIEWFWKSNKKKYRDTFKKLFAKNEKRKIKKYDEKIIARIKWTFYCMKKQCCFSNFKLYNIKNDFEFYIVIRNFRIKNIIDEKKSNYIQKNWYNEIYRYYIEQKSLKNLNKISIIVFKRKANNYR